MRSVGSKLLKNKLGEYIRLAAAGETVLVTDRDQVVAELGLPAPGRSPLVSDALLLDAVRQGWIGPPLSARREMPARKSVMKLCEILADLHSRSRRAAMHPATLLSLEGGGRAGIAGPGLGAAAPT